MSKYEKLPEPFKTNWINALRSGEYEQGKMYLYMNGKYCCLGVACVISGISTDELKKQMTIPENFTSIPDIIKGNIIRLDDEKSGNLVWELTSMNDGGENGDNSKSFLEISDFIEQNL